MVLLLLGGGVSGGCARGDVNCAADRRRSPGATLGLFLDMPIVVHRQVRGHRLYGHAVTSSSNMTVEVPQFQFIDRVRDDHSRCVIETGTQGQTVEFHRCSSWTRCSLTAGGASTRQSMCQ